MVIKVRFIRCFKERVVFKENDWSWERVPYRDYSTYHGNEEATDVFGE